PRARGLPLNPPAAAADDTREPWRPRVPPLEPERSSTPPSRTMRWRMRERPEAADQVAAWCAGVARLLHVARRLGPDNEAARSLERRLVPEMVKLADMFGPLILELTPRSIVLGDETVF